jgi:hypothetical protein
LPLVSGRAEHIAAALSNGKVLVAGGFNDTDTGPSTERYDPAMTAPRPVLLTVPPTQSQSGFRFMFRNTPGLEFSVLRAPNLDISIEGWALLGPAVEVSPGRYQFTDPGSGNPQNFYRVRSP